MHYKGHMILVQLTTATISQSLNDSNVQRLNG